MDNRKNTLCGDHIRHSVKICDQTVLDFHEIQCWGSSREVVQHISWQSTRLLQFNQNSVHEMFTKTYTAGVGFVNISTLKAGGGGGCRKPVNKFLSALPHVLLYYLGTQNAVQHFSVSWTFVQARRTLLTDVNDLTFRRASWNGTTFQQ
jgi:hypothetical protein